MHRPSDAPETPSSAAGRSPDPSDPAETASADSTADPITAADSADATAEGVSTAASKPDATTPASDEDDEGRSTLAGVASAVVDVAQAGVTAAARPIRIGVEGLASGVGELASGARRAFGERAGARVRRVRRMGQRPLANLWEEHPESRRAAIRELGLQTVSVAEIAGTAVEGAPQRGGDFLPLRERRSDDWRGRWQRILKAADNLVNLPPVELVKFGDEYWVVDGHNRVAAALYNGQVSIDAVVDELRLPGMRGDRTPTEIASTLDGSSELRQAGSGRFSRTGVRHDRLPSRLEPTHDHANRRPGRDAAPTADGEAE